MSTMNINWLHLLVQRPLVTILFFALISCCLLVILQTIESNSQDDDSGSSDDLTRRNIVAYEPFYNKQSDVDHHQYKTHYSNQDVDSLTVRIEDLKRIKLSVSNELRTLQREKTKILKDKALLVSKNERILSQINKNKIQLKQLELDISANKKQKLSQSCSSGVVAPLIFNPLRWLDLTNYSRPDESFSGENAPAPTNLGQTTNYKFDLSLCSLAKHFSFNLSVVGPEQSSKVGSNNQDITTLSTQILQSHRQYSNSNSQDHCMTITLLDNPTTRPTFNSRNNLVINLSGQSIDKRIRDELTKQSFIASPSFRRGHFRHNTDLVIPSILQPHQDFNTIVGSIPLQSPIQRKYFVSYFGNNQIGDGSNKLSPIDRILQTIHRSSIDDMFLFIYDCGPNTNRICFNERGKMIELSTFLIIIPKDLYDIDQDTNDLIYLALSRGTIPVIVGSDKVRLPFDEVIDWRRATIQQLGARLPEIHFILRSLAPADLYSLKYHGRRIFESYLATSKQILSTIVSLMSLNRLNYPPPPIEQVKTETYFPSQDLIMDINCTLLACQEAKSDSMSNLLASETFGPREKPFASFTFRRNFSLILNNAYDLWNHPLHSPNHLFPSHPSDPIPPSEYKFMSSNQGYRPIGDGLGGSGMEFSQAIGGDYPNEQFTIVLLTYERISLLMKTLERLKGLAYLNKILVVWNGIEKRPQDDIIWPDVGVPIVLVKADRNSLNNRFLPYDAIETDAIFSMDDDSPLRPDEIVFAFRVWRESRDRIVGFPGRFHAWDSYQNSWIYNSNHSCELSMVLTGGAFFHKYYSHVYSQIMPETIRSIVDKFMNCEDIAMNFLVAHLTRKPPIKVTSRWTFHCASCSSSLSEDNSHFMERHECLNIFTSIYGYMPLLNTQHRSDSILFKTRLPKDKQKCFKFV